MKNKQNTSLQKSHSAWSNLKLTLLCVLTVIAVTVFWGTLALADRLPLPLAILLSALSLGLTVLCVIAFNKFHR